MKPDPTPQLPPVLPGFSEPVMGPLKVTSEIKGGSEDIASIIQGESAWSTYWHGSSAGEHYSLRLGSTIALANGIGVEPTSDPCESVVKESLTTESTKPDVTAEELERDHAAQLADDIASHEGDRMASLQGLLKPTPPKPEGETPISNQARFTITWRDAAYYVSIPSYQGGDVVPYKTAMTLEVRLGTALSDLAAARATITSLRAALEAVKEAWENPEMGWVATEKVEAALSPASSGKGEA